MKLLKTILTPLVILTLAGCGGSDSTTDMSAPVVADVVSDSKIVETLQPQLSGSCSGDGNVSIYVDGNKIEQEATCTNGSYSLTLDENLTHGRHCFDTAQDNSIRSPQTCVFTGVPFVTTWNTNHLNFEGTETNNKKIRLTQSTTSGADSATHLAPTSTYYEYNFFVDWDDGNSDANVTDLLITHTYDEPGIYTVKINGIYPHFHQRSDRSDFGFEGYNFRQKLISIDQWGSMPWKPMLLSFASYQNLELNATDVPNLKDVSDMRWLFSGTPKFNQDIGDWDTSSVTDMSYMFYNATSFNQDISKWNFSNVESMREMFNGAKSFSTQNYDKLLISLSNQNLKRDVSFGANDTMYSSAATNARQKLINDFNWSISDKGLEP